MKYVIVYQDGAYEGNRGSGFPVRLIEEAGQFSTIEEANRHAVNLVDVDVIRPMTNEEMLLLGLDPIPDWNNSCRIDTASPHKLRFVRRYMINRNEWCWVCYRPADGFFSTVGVCNTPRGAYYEWQNPEY